MRLCFKIILAAALMGLLTVSLYCYQECDAEPIKLDEEELIYKANEILKDRHCPCQCGKYLPGSPTYPACFGCSAGKAEITYVLESLDAGKEAQEIIMDISSPVIIDVFADYTNKYLYKTWQLVKKVSAELHQKRVILRAPGFTIEAQQAIRFAECARLGENFSVVQELLIQHQGPWELNTLFSLTGSYDLEREQIRKCVDRIDIEEQIMKDQQHAEERDIYLSPTITINRKKVPSTDQAIRMEIKRVLFERGT